MKVNEAGAWVVYKMTLSQGSTSRNAVCTQSEWDEMETARPGYHSLIRAHIGNEGEAERLARDLQTPPAPPKPARLSQSAVRMAAQTAESVVHPTAAPIAGA